MYAVIFTATVAVADDEYLDTAKHMRELAIREYGCLGFVSATEGDREIAISYWPSLAAIANWKQNSQHLRAQGREQRKWYTHYRVQITEVLRDYQGDRSVARNQNIL